jgi:hypothetical protein
MLVHIDQDTGADALPELPASRPCTNAARGDYSESKSAAAALSVQHACSPSWPAQTFRRQTTERPHDLPNAFPTFPTSRRDSTEPHTASPVQVFK